MEAKKTRMSKQGKDRKKSSCAGVEGRGEGRKDVHGEVGSPKLSTTNKRGKDKHRIKNNEEDR